MGFYVKDLLQAATLKKARVLGGSEGLENEIKGVTIIEAPDIVKFINGGEVLLTGLYAYKSCTAEEFRMHLNELAQKDVSAIVMKRGRNVEAAEEKIKMLIEFSKEQKTAVLEVPFDVSFRDVLGFIMEHLLNEEVVKLKYFKTTHDNFAALTVSKNSTENALDNILDVLAKLIGNPAALFSWELSCLAATEGALQEFHLQKGEKNYEPGLYSNYGYFRQKVKLPGTNEKSMGQYVICMKIVSGVQMYLVITEQNRELDSMDYIAIENAVTALKQEFVRQQAVWQLEKKFQNDILHNILNGKIDSMEDLRKRTNLLGMPVEGSYRVVVFGFEEAEENAENFDRQIQDVSLLNEAVSAFCERAKVQSDFDKVVAVQLVDRNQKLEEYRREIRTAASRIQAYVKKQNKHLKVKAGAGKVVEGIAHLQESFQEAGDALMFADIAKEISGEESGMVMLFSDMGIFKLLCQLKEPELLLEYVPESLRKLYSYRKSQRDDLVLTLKTYLDRNQNLSKTAQDLYIHYKTAAYRVDRITEITGIDFDNASEVLSVRIGMIVYKMIEKSEIK